MECSKEYDRVHLKKAIFEQKVAHCIVCRGVIKPDIVMFGEPLNQVK